MFFRLYSVSLNGGQIEMKTLLTYEPETGKSVFVKMFQLLICIPC